MLLAVKILVVSRLLHKKLSQRPDPPPYLELQRDKLASLRRKLLTKIDRRLQDLETSESVLVEAMCAFSLATSASITDVLRHFHHVRQSTIPEIGTRRGDERGIFKSLSLLIKSLKDCQAIFPTQIARALEKLKAAPLLRSSDLCSLPEINLDIHQQRLGEDINNFIPYIRHDDLQKVELNRLSKHWARQAFSSFFKQLSDKLNDIKEPTIVVQLRQEMLELWLSNHRLSFGIDISEVLEGIRDTFRTRLQDLIYQYTTDLSIVASAITSQLESWRSGMPDTCPSMWDDTMTTLDTVAGSRVLKEALSTRAYGRNKPVQTVSEAYRTWLRSIRELESVIQRMQAKKWADDIDEMNDEEDVSEDIQTLLSEDDPRLLQETLNDALKENFQNFYNMMQTHTKELQRDRRDGIDAGSISSFLLRVMREIAHQLPSSYPDPEYKHGFIATLQTQISTTVLQQPISRFEKRASKSWRQNHLQIRILWEGEPKLPVLPSPYAFRLLHDVMRSMIVFGADIWTPQAMKVLKRQLREVLAPILISLPDAGRSQVNGLKSSSSTNNGVAQDPNGPEGESNLISTTEEHDAPNDDDEDLEEARTRKTHSESPRVSEEPSEEVLQDMKTQRLFDTLYLRNAFGSGDSDVENAVDDTQQAIVSSLSLADREVNRMKKDAGTYWKRTELLFALLA